MAKAFSKLAANAGTRQAVLAEARRGFAAKGYSAVSMRDIAQGVGIQQSAIYNHFDGKQALLFELLIQHMDTLWASLHEAMMGIKEPSQQLARFAQFHVEYHIDYPDDVFIAYMELRSLEADNHRRVVGLRDGYEATLRKIIEAGMACGEFHCEDAAVHARALIAMLTGVTVWYRDNGRLNKHSVVQCYVTAAMQSVGIATPTKSLN